MDNTTNNTNRDEIVYIGNFNDGLGFVTTFRINGVAYKYSVEQNVAHRIHAMQGHSVRKALNIAKELGKLI